ncbi:MAG TPA: glycine cleavage system protein H [Candidatus Polarisedimenticolaceae bacterium]|nr:glycine cleavage system protein H [Candidatus Polarisedimenticolaceae bacterium]
MNNGMLAELQAAKTIEYLLAVGFLVLFVPFWRFAEPRGPALEAQPARRAARVPTGWFHVPDGVALHPGHAWARSATDGEVVVGVDDFARAVIGPIGDVDLPAAGTPIRQGEPAITLRGAAGSLPVVSPVDGLVVARNPAARLHAVESDPYGDGWLLRVHAPRLAANGRQLLTGSTARAFMEDVAERLRGVVAPTLGPALADGGLPVSGFAAELPPEAWERIKSEFFFADGGGVSWKA